MLSAEKGVYSYADGVPGTDGIYTKESGVFFLHPVTRIASLSTFYAPKHQLIGLAHAGWKGTAKGIAREMLRKWQQDEGVSPSDVLAAIGPSIGGCCYVVDDRVLEEMKLQLQGAVPHRMISKGAICAGFKRNQPSDFSCRKDSRRRILLFLRFCTSCEEALFFSRIVAIRGKTGRMLSFIGFKEV
ncbi:hypothetical protein GCM10020331_045950 [Ectobacillus funiculus]